MYASTLYCRVVPQERGRGWMLLVSWEKPVVQRTCTQLITLSGVTQASLDATKARVQADYRVAKLDDVTPDNVVKQLQREFKNASGAPSGTVNQ